MTLGSFGTPDFYMEFKLAQEMAIQEAPGVIDEVFSGFKEMTGREYAQVVPYMCDDAEIIMLTMGSMSGTAREAVNQMRSEGKKVGCLKLTVYRPFPFKEIYELVKDAKAFAIVERDISPGFGGAVFADAAGLFVNLEKKPMLLDYIVGLGGRDVVPQDFRTVVGRAEKALAEGGPLRMAEWINVNWDNMPEGTDPEKTGSGWSKEVFQ
jgi:pyruvate ferredoxin oxidoreductase alpha subunit